MTARTEPADRPNRRPDGRRPAMRFHTLGASTLWSADEAERVLDFLDALRADLWAAYGEEIRHQRYEDEQDGCEEDERLDAIEPDLHSVYGVRLGRAALAEELGRLDAEYQHEIEFDDLPF